jgi:DNA-directed RNA polymerase
VGSKVTYKQCRQSTVITYQPEFLRAQEALLAQAQNYCACLWPMLCEPNDWTGQHSGGYLTNDIRKLSRLVRVRDYGGSTVLRNSKALAMLNTLQRVPYRINPIVLSVANFCMEHRISVGKFRAEDPTPPPPKPEPWETAPEEDKLTYRKARTEIEDRNSFLAQNNYRTIECLFVANKYQDDPFWIPWSFDYRGRCYPIPTSLSPQGTDFEKSLFLFEEEGLVVQWWLAFQVATTYGLDKATMDDRLTCQ